MQQDTQQQKDNAHNIDIMWIVQNMLRVIKRMWLPTLLIMALCAVAVAALRQKIYTPSYKAYCTFSVHVVNKATLGDTNSLYAVYYDQDLAEQLDVTFSYLMTSDLLKDDIKAYMGTTSIDGTIAAESIKGSNIFVISAQSGTPEKAGALLDAVMAVYYDNARIVVGDMTTEIIEGPVVSQTPHNQPSFTRNLALGALVGLALCMALMLAYVLLQRTVFEPSDLESYLNMQCFGVVPLMPTKRNMNDAPAEGNNLRDRGSFRESIRGIARKLDNAMTRQGCKVIVVTSTAAGEGKSVISQNLAESFAHWGKKVVLLDGDLRKPSLYRRYGFKYERMSLEAVLTGLEKPDTILRQRRDGKLTLVLNSVVVENPTVVIDSPAMKKLIKSLSDKADIVIIDTPPCGQLTDASLYLQHADGILYVVQQDYMDIPHIVEAAEKLNSFENKLLGYALNGVQHMSQGYGKYGYGEYSYGKYGGYYGKYGSYYHQHDQEKDISER